ncbi:hypothetical protein LTR96_004648 [Exophiala xenobiotica]|nr:hypothetical protein LTR96_004648 [Exophiala xenobiotica]KAK5340269.1 hypothetical protein LTR98_003390 [Exophiala xenobiotica]
MADYSQYAAPSEDWVRVTKDLFLPPPPPLTTLQQRRNFRKINNEGRVRASENALAVSGAAGITIATTTITTRDFQEIGARSYLPQHGCGGNTLLYFHGGGFFSGSLATEDAFCINLARNCGVAVVSVNYRHTPEWPYPTAFEDAWDARCRILHSPLAFGIPSLDKLLVAGISSGACLAASIVVQERKLNENKISGQALWTPWLCHPDTFPIGQIISPEKASPVQCKDAPLLPQALALEYANMLQMDESQKSDSVANPLLSESGILKSAPPTHILVAGQDPLRDHGLLFQKRLAEAGIPTTSTVYPGLPHGFVRIAGLEANSRWNEDIEEGVRWLLKQ